MKKIILLISLLLIVILPSIVWAQATPQEEVDLYSSQVQESHNQASTLADTLKYFDTSIVLNQKDSNNIDALIATYKSQVQVVQSAEKSPFAGLTWNEILSHPFDTLWHIGKQLLTPVDKQKQQATALLITARKEQLDKLTIRSALQRQQLDRLRSEKAYLLLLTQNDEKKYQQLLTNAQEILKAQQAIFSGKVPETFIEPVKQGEKIGTVIAGSSTCSTGTHLHFEIRLGNIAVNPATFLSTAPYRWSLQPLQQVQFTGTWPWPITLPVILTQEFGMSWFAQPGGFSVLGAYGGQPHTGLDMISEGGNLDVFAPVDGTLFRGSIGCGGSQLSYLRIQQSPAVSVYFLHTTQ